MDTLFSLLGKDGHLPHGDSFAWSPGLLWSMVGADAVIAAACFSILFAALSYLRKRPEATANWPVWPFTAFIFAFAISHVMDMWTLWQPDYALQALTKIATAATSLIAAIALWMLIPRALRASSVQQLRTFSAEREAEVIRRRSAEDRLAAAEESLAATLASIDAGFIAVDRDGKVTQMNAVAETVTGRRKDDALGMDLWTVLTRSDIDKQGTGMAILLRDVSRFAQAEAESSRLAAIVESSHDAIIGKTLDGRITSWNRAAQVIFGYSAEEAIGQPVQMLIPPERQAEEMRILHAIAHGEKVPAFDTVRMKRSGERLDVQITVSPIMDGAGRVVGASKNARDVSLQRRAEAALRDSEEQLRFTLEAARIGDWNLDLATGVMQHSRRHDRCFGYADLQDDWNFDKFIQHVHPDDRAEVEQTLDVAIKELRDWRVQCRVVWPDDTVHWISKHGGVQRQGDKVTRMLGIVSEITEQRQAENARLTAQRLEVENRQFQEANRLKSQFLANMSHELRTPLNAVIGFADLLHAGFVKPDSPEHKEFLGHIGTSGRHLLQLINDVLDLSKVESGKFEFYPEPVDLAVILKEVQTSLYTAATSKDIMISTEIDGGLADLRLDPARLKQVLSNFLSNAVKFTASGGHVTVRFMSQGLDHFRIEVEDTGIGISAADLPRLFTEFQQLDTGYSRQHQGTGLGLALTRRLVEAQGGQVGVRSTVGAGSVFYVVLNRKHGLDNERAEAAAQGLRKREADRVLVIEDDLRDQALLVDALAQAGFEVDAAADGPFALRRARETAYGALTLDLSLPGQRGLELLDEIRSKGASHASPVVGVSMPAHLEMSATFAIANVLRKPMRSDEIASAMARFKLPGPRRAKVMVIDDEQVSLDLMRATLKSLGIDAVCFQDGRVALQEIDRLGPDAIVLDLMMPEFDGFQVLDALQHLPAWREVPVFIWTSMMLTDDEYATLARSARAILIKGGGAMDSVLESVRRWRQPVVAGAEVKW